MKVIILEDELLAQEKLETMLVAIDKRISIEAKIRSVKKAIEWIKTHPSPDLAFVDIQLSDDHSFEIFRKLPVAFPIVFTTAYDKYLMESFEFNSIDYLLKPITEEKLKRSLEKVRSLEQHFLQGNLLRLIQPQSEFEKTRIVARKGMEFTALELDTVAYFYTDHKLVFACDAGGRRLIVDKNLSELEAVLNKRNFFRINRKYIAHLNGIDRFRPDNGRIRIYLKPEMAEEILVSKETAPAFRVWVAGEVRPT